MGLDLAFYALRSYSLIRPPRTGRRLIRSRERSATRVVGPGRPELAPAVGASSVVGPGVLGEKRSQVARTPGRDLRCCDTGDGQNRVEGVGKLPGAVADQELEVLGS